MPTGRWGFVVREAPLCRSTCRLLPACRGVCGWLQPAPTTLCGRSQRRSETSPYGHFILHWRRRDKIDLRRHLDNSPPLPRWAVSTTYRVRAAPYPIASTSANDPLHLCMHALPSSMIVSPPTKGKQKRRKGWWIALSPAINLLRKVTTNDLALATDSRLPQYWIVIEIVYPQKASKLTTLADKTREKPITINPRLLSASHSLKSS